MIVTQPVVHDFPRVAVPTLLIIGRRDRTAIGKDRAPEDAVMGDYPALGKRTAAAIPNAKLVELAGAGHLPQIEQFDAYAAALTRSDAQRAGAQPSSLRMFSITSA